VGALFIASYFGAPPVAEVIGRNVAVNTGATNLQDVSAHNSPSIVRNPVNDANLVIVNRIDNPFYSCALHVSPDGGASWSQTPIPKPRGEQPKCYAPDVAFGADGSLYLTFVTLAGRGNVPNAVWLARSHDGGLTLSEPVKILGPLAFQIRVVADPSVPGRLYLTWLQGKEVALLRFAEPGNPIRFARSDDGGASWHGPVRVSSPDRQRVIAPSPALGPNGELYVFFLDVGDDRLDYDGAHQGQGGPPYPGYFTLVLARSLDSGATWSESVVDASIRPTQRFIVFIPPLPSVAIDRDGGTIYAAYQDGRAGDADVSVWASRDGGNSWARTRVNDTELTDGTSQYLPEVEVAPNGRVDVLYYDRRADPDDIMNEVSLQSSLDGGRTFGRSLRVSDAAFDPRIGFGSQRNMTEIGNRLALLSTETRALAAWTDTRAGTPVSGKQDIVRAMVSFSERPRLPHVASTVLRYGGVAHVVTGMALLAMLALSRLRDRRDGKAGGRATE
jgi:hypothetical protein